MIPDKETKQIPCKTCPILKRIFCIVACAEANPFIEGQEAAIDEHENIQREMAYNQDRFPVNRPGDKTQPSMRH